MRVSVVIPAYNAQRYLAQAIESVLAQTMPDWELTVVDDGSHDGTAGIACQYAERDTRLRVVRQVNGGVANARNHGFVVSACDSLYVSFLDADDVWEKDALEVLLRALEAHPECVAASGLSRVIDGRGRLIEPGGLEAWGRQRRGVVRGRLAWWQHQQPTSLAVLAYRNCIYTPGQMLVRRAALEAVGPYDRAASPCEDWDMSLRLSRRGDIAYVDRVVLNWRRHGGNASGRAEILARQALYVRRKLLLSPRLSAEQRELVRAANRLWGLGVGSEQLVNARRSILSGHLRLGARQLRRALRIYWGCARGIPVP